VAANSSFAVGRQFRSKAAFFAKYAGLDRRMDKAIKWLSFAAWQRSAIIAEPVQKRVLQCLAEQAGKL